MPAVSSHVRALLTWLAVFPLVVVVSAALRPFSDHLSNLACIAIMTGVVVPTTVYLVVPRYLRIYHRARRTGSDE